VRFGLPDVPRRDHQQRPLVLQESGRFSAGRVSFDTVEWPNGADLCPEVLYEESVAVDEPAGAMA